MEFFTPTFTLTQTPYQFRPQDAWDKAAPCQNGGVDNCHVPFTAALYGLSGTGNEGFLKSLNPVFAFRLSQLSPRLPGTSTNYSPPACNGAPPGPGNNCTPAGNPPPLYLFEAALNSWPPDADGLGIGNIVPLQLDDDPVLPLTVTSHDYGGKAYLRGTVTLTGDTGPVTIDAEIIDPTTGLDVLPPVDNPATSGTCGADFTNHPFASLPVDQDCNGIADSWEQPYLQDAGTNDLHCGGVEWTMFLGSEDLEYSLLPGGVADCGSNRGDGYTVFDEYRGFHEYNPTTKSLVWKSTDPVNAKDLYFFDPTGLFTGAIVRQPTDTQDTLFVQQFPFINLHPLSAAVVTVDPDTGQLQPNNRNGSGSVRNYRTFPIYLLNASLGGNCNVRNGTPIQAVLGGAPNFPPPAAPDGRPIQLDSAMINSCAPGFGFKEADFRQIVLAHEIGHNLSLQHPKSFLDWQAEPDYRRDLSSLVLLGENKYTYEGQTSTEVYSWFMDYWATTFGTYQLQAAEHIQGNTGLEAGVFGIIGPVSVARPLHPVSTIAFPDVAQFGQHRSVFRSTFSPPISGHDWATRENVEFIDSTHLNIMNWTFRYDFLSPTSYQFTPLQKQELCFQTVAPKACIVHPSIDGH